MDFGKPLIDALAGTKTLGPAALRNLGVEADSAAAGAASLAARAVALKSRVADVDGGIGDVRENFSDVRPVDRPWAAGGGGVRRALDQLVPDGRIPSARGGAFATWCGQLAPEELERVRAVPELRDVVDARLRRAGRPAPDSTK